MTPQQISTVRCARMGGLQLLEGGPGTSGRGLGPAVWVQTLEPSSPADLVLQRADKSVISALAAAQGLAYVTPPRRYRTSAPQVPQPSQGFFWTFSSGSRLTDWDSLELKSSGGKVLVLFGVREPFGSGRSSSGF